jgi:hypothetical protein
MVSIFVGDLRASGRDPSALAGELTALAASLADGAERLATAIVDFADRVGAVQAGVHDVDAQLRVVRALEVNGRVEGARLDDHTITDLFGTIAHQVADAREQLRTFTALRDAASGTDARRDAAAVRGVILEAAERVEVLAGA